MERYEIKYLIPLELASRLEQIVARHAVPDAASSNGKYMVRSIYLDTPDLQFCHEKLDGCPYRKKYRFRTYDTDGANGYFEIKYKRYSKVSKYRVKISRAQWNKVLELLASGNENQVEFETGDPSAFVFNTIYHSGVAPVNTIEYERRAFIVPGDDPFRVTFDMGLSARLERDGEIREKSDRHMFPELTILELKPFRNLPLWLFNMIKEYQLVSRSVSKYVLSLDYLGLIRGLN